MPEGRKLVLIGAGSVAFSRGLLADVMSPAGRGIDRLALVDLDEGALARVTALARRMAEGRRDGLRIEAHTDRRKALADADYVVVTIAVGGNEARLQDLRIPRRYGIYLPVGDTVGPAGVSRVLRHAPVLAEIAADVGECCDRAWLFNFSNPLSALVRAATLVRPERTVGLCHGLPDRARRTCRFVGVEPTAWELDCAGLNHVTWVTCLRVGGVDVLAEARAKLAAGERGSWLDDSPFSRDLFLHYGAMLVPGDRHVIEFYPQFHRHGYDGGKRPGIDVWSIDALMAGRAEVVARMTAEASGDRPLDPALFERQAGEHEALLDIFAAIESDSGRVFTGNVPNHGLVPQLPSEAVVEVPLVMRPMGWEGRCSRPLPPAPALHQADRARQQDLNVRAALTGDRDLALESLVADGWVTGYDQARRLLADLLEAQRPYLPRFFG